MSSIGSCVFCWFSARKPSCLCVSSLTEEELERLAKRSKESKQRGTQKQYATQLRKWEVRLSDSLFFLF